MVSVARVSMKDHWFWMGFCSVTLSFHAYSIFTIEQKYTVYREKIQLNTIVYLCGGCVCMSRDWYNIYFKYLLLSFSRKNQISRSRNVVDVFTKRAKKYIIWPFCLLRFYCLLIFFCRAKQNIIFIHLFFSFSVCSSFSMLLFVTLLEVCMEYKWETKVFLYSRRPHPYTISLFFIYIIHFSLVFSLFHCYSKNKILQFQYFYSKILLLMLPFTCHMKFWTQ